MGKMLHQWFHPLAEWFMVQDSMVFNNFYMKCRGICWCQCRTFLNPLPDQDEWPSFWSRRYEIPTLGSTMQYFTKRGEFILPSRLITNRLQHGRYVCIILGFKSFTAKEIFYTVMTTPEVVGKLYKKFIIILTYNSLYGFDHMQAKLISIVDYLLICVSWSWDWLEFLVKMKSFPWRWHSCPASSSQCYLAVVQACSPLPARKWWILLARSRVVPFEPLANRSLLRW